MKPIKEVYMQWTYNKIPKVGIRLSFLIFIVIVFVFIRQTQATNSAVFRMSHTQEVLIAGEKYFLVLMENNYDIISMPDQSFKAIYRNPSAFRITDWTNEKVKNSEGTENCINL